MRCHVTHAGRLHLEARQAVCLDDAPSPGAGQPGSLAHVKSCCVCVEPLASPKVGPTALARLSLPDRGLETCVCDPPGLGLR